MIILTRETPIFSDWRFLLAALGKHNVPEGLRYVKVASGKGYATNGVRLHVLDDAGFRDGFYEVFANKETEIILEPIETDLRWPEVDGVIQKAEKYTKSTAISLEADSIRFSLAVFELFRTLPFPVNIEYLKPLADDCRSWEVRWDAKSYDPILFLANPLRAYIMPIYLGGSGDTSGG